MLRTWDAHSTQIRALIVENVKADLARRIAATVKVIDVESEEPLPVVEDQVLFEAELRRELEHSYDRLNVPENKRRRVNGELRDSSIELSEPLDPPVDADEIRGRAVNRYMREIFGEDNDDNNGADGSGRGDDNGADGSGGSDDNGAVGSGGGDDNGADGSGAGDSDNDSDGDSSTADEEEATS